MTLSYCNEFILTLQELFEIPNLKHQITNKSQIPNANNLNYFDFFSIDENIIFSSFASCIKFRASLAFFKII